MKNMRLSVKLIGCFLVVALIGALIGAVGIIKIRAIEKEAGDMYLLNTKPLGETGGVAIAYQRIRNNLRDTIIDKFVLGKDVDGYVGTINQLNKKIDEDLAKVEKSLQTEEGRKEFAALKGAFVKFEPVMNKTIELVKSGKKDEAMGLMRGEALTLARTIDASINRIFDLKIEFAKRSAEASAAAARSAIIFSLLITIIGVMVALGGGILLTRSITVPISRVTNGLSEGADQVASASSQVSSSSQSLAEGASEQAAALEETSSSLEEMSSMTKQNADSSYQAKTMMTEVKQVVDDVNHHMGQMAEAVAEITKSSEETGKIIKTIDEIAFQTNLLALNAAVEAARAGEAGAGFAVVADEVRNLAMRAAEAAKNTSNLIENTIKSVKNGNELTVSTQEAFKKNVEIATKVTKLIEEIAAASKEQAQGIEQISKAVAEMDKVVQQNAANAEESASASEEMTAQAEQMKAFVGELVMVVGGSSNGQETKKKAPSRSARGPEMVAEPSPGNGKSKLLSGKKKDLAPPKPKEINPDQVIPMGTDLKNF
jgi:methyl-accepting chemotaxis protein